MNLDLVKAFAMLAETCHFGQASRLLNISQPSLTKQIKRLEGLLGAALFRRDRQGAVLTAYGVHFLSEVQPILRQAELVWAKTIRAAQGERGRLRIGFTYSSVVVMAKVLLRFQSRYPEVEVAIEDISSTAQIALIKEGGLDVGFMRLPSGGELAFFPVTRDRLAFVFPNSMAADIKDFDSDIVRTLPFLGIQAGLAPGLETSIQRLFTSRGFTPRVVHRVNGALTQLVLIAAGMGVALMHDSALRRVVDLVDGVVVRPIADPIATWQEGLVWRHDEENPVVAQFLRSARETIGNGQTKEPSEDSTGDLAPRRRRSRSASGAA